jgi:hypothetical protein
MRKFAIIIVFIALSVSFISCSAKKSVRKAQNPESKQEQNDNLLDESDDDSADW